MAAVRDTRVIEYLVADLLSVRLHLTHRAFLLIRDRLPQLLNQFLAILRCECGY